MVSAPFGWQTRRQRSWPLGLTLGAHLVLAWCWYQPRTPVHDSVQQATFDTLWIAVPRAQPSTAAPPAPRVPPPLARPRPSALNAPPAPAPVAAEPPDMQAQAALDQAPAEPSTNAPFGEDAAHSIATRARATAGAVDRGLRKGQLAPLTPGDNPWLRFRAAVAGAHVETRRTRTMESYTGPDGVTIYRFQAGGRTYCRTGGSIRPRIDGAYAGGTDTRDAAGDGRHAGIIQCPTNVVWTRE